MLKVCRFNPIPGAEGGCIVYLPPPPSFCHKIWTAIDFSQNFLTFLWTIKTYKEIMVFLGVLLKEGSHFQLLFEKLLEKKPKNNVLLAKNPKTW